MGRPYAEEMSALPHTYAWAQKYDTSAIRKAVLAASSMPLVAVGSGGSMTTAAWLAYLHHKAFRALAHTATPLQLESLLPVDRRVSVWLLSASGRNTDILRGLETAVLAEPSQLVVLCAAEESPLSDKAAAHPWTTRLGFASPAGRDGFLATNSLFASCVLLSRAVLEGARQEQLPDRLDTLLEAVLPDARSLEVIDARCVELWQRDTLLVLHGNAGQVAGIDIESRFTEAALGRVQLADFRNFAHGRHHWLAKRGSESAVLAIVDPGIAKLADETLRLLPADIPVARFELADDSVGSALAGVYLALRLAESAGRARGIDPGRPGVPEFGRRIYNLRPPKSRRSGPSDLSAEESIAIERKAGVPLHTLDSALDRWRDALAQALETLQGAEIRAVVLDHDGTLVTTEKRRSPPEASVVAALVRLLELGVPLGIATGRGGSVREDLQKVIPQTLWPRVLIGYRNGSELGVLDENEHPSDSETPCEELAPVEEKLRASPLAGTLKLKTRPGQITVVCDVPLPDGALWAAVMEALGRHAQAVHAVRSSHSVDILASGVSKQAVVEHLARQHGIDPGNILRIGDRGRWPGNDFDLLDHALGLSVDEVSRRPDACWNLAPAGERGINTTLRYLGALASASKRAPARLRLRLGKRRP
jgi:Sucrose-6F-phosphate phosphohydrolase